MEFFLIYLFVMSGKIASMLLCLGKTMLIPCLILMAVVTFISVINGLDSDFDDAWNHPVSVFIKRFAKWLVPIGLFFIIVANLIPNEKQLAIIVGSGVAYNVLTSEPAQRIGGKALELLQKKIDKALEDEDNDGSQTKEEKEIEQAPQSGSQESAQGAST